MFMVNLSQTMSIGTFLSLDMAIASRIGFAYSLIWYSPDEINIGSAPSYSNSATPLALPGSTARTNLVILSF